MHNNITLEFIYNSCSPASLAIVYEISYALFGKWKRIKTFVDEGLTEAALCEIRENAGNTFNADTVSAAFRCLKRTGIR